MDVSSAMLHFPTVPKGDIKVAITTLNNKRNQALKDLKKHILVGEGCVFPVPLPKREADESTSDFDERCDLWYRAHGKQHVVRDY